MLKDVYEIPSQETPQPLQPRAPRPVEYYRVPTLPFVQPTRPIPVNLAVQADGDNPMLPKMWWIMVYLGLVGLTAIGIRASSN